MGKPKKGTLCCVEGCSKRRKKIDDGGRSDSDGSDDEETPIKRRLSRTFHRYVGLQIIFSMRPLDHPSNSRYTRTVGTISKQATYR